MKKDSIKEYFINHLANDSIVSKEDIVNFALECNIEINKRTAKAKIIDKIIDQGHYEKLFETFQEFITMPFWEVADFYGVQSNKIGKLKDIGFFKEEAIPKEFYSRRDKGYFTANTYPLSILDYDIKELMKVYDNAFGGSSHELRIETKTKEEVKELINILHKIFKMDKEPATYAHRNDAGYYTYFKVKLLNNTEAEENLLLSEINDLKLANEETKSSCQNRIEEIKKYHTERYERLFNVLKKYLGEDVDVFNFERKLQELVDVKEVNKLNTIQSENIRNAGRKPKFTNDDILQMKSMKENGNSYNDIAKVFNTTKVTIIKYLKHNEKVK